MPVPVFTSGEVLTAANMNKVGMWRIQSQTFTSQIQIDFLNVFTSNFMSYRIIFDQITASAAGEFQLRVRDASGVIATNNYLTQRIEAVATTITGVGTGAVSAFLPTYTAASSTAAAGASGYIDVHRPQVNDYTRLTGKFARTNSTGDLYDQTFSGFFNLTTVLTGFSIIRPGTATISGSVSVYGFNK